MLRELEIKNILLIKRLSLNFSSGLNAFTGETGTGKSILLDCLGFVLGARGQASIVRDGTDRGEVTAIFSLESYSKVNLILDEAGIKQSDELIIRRVNFLDGRKSAWINDKRVSSEFLRNLGENLIEFHGQHDERGLLDAKGHLQLLDQFAQTAPFLNSVKKAFLILKENQKAVETFIRENQKLTEEEDLIRHNLEEISNLGTYSGEEAELDTKRRLMQNSQSIRENISEASVLVDRDAAEGQLSNAIKWLEKAANNVENVLDEPIEALRRAQSELQEAQSAIFDVLSSLSFNSEELEILEDRLFSIRGLSRKHKISSDQLPDFENKLKEKLAFIENGTKNIESLKINYDKSLKEFSTLSKRLSNEREKAASILDKMIEEELKPLKMERARFKTAITQVSPNEFGQDSVTFTISTNSGSSFGALIKIASGGELSRFLLALKVCLTNDQKGVSMVFDEIDRGVGGATADAVGRRLLQLAKKNAQVLVVTHSPQVAALAERHFVVSKVIDDDRPLSSVNEVKGEDCVEEIARMISGDTITDEAREASRVLISGASMS
jgi:DNA repair protein RecN (Recombination protein N)|tara:strand:- start:1144 stop:2808 length:1665 start_codon:yes stop_codon:yes gene_type:complete